MQINGKEEIEFWDKSLPDFYITFIETDKINF